jgi:hypothetical protein
VQTCHKRSLHSIRHDALRSLKLANKGLDVMHALVTEDD